jgi:integrase/recombinase XerD
VGCWLRPLQVTIQYTPRQTPPPAKLAPVQTTALKLAHHLLNLGRRPPPLPGHNLFTAHAAYFNTQILRCLECGWPDAYLPTTIADYLAEIKLTKKPKTHSAYSTALEYFQESCPKFCLEDLDRKDLLKFAAFLRDDKEQAQRSCWNKFSNVMTFLKAQGIRGLAGKNDWPRYTEEEPEVYEQEELDKLFAACDAEERLWYEFFLMTGEREQEVMYTEWRDINLVGSIVRVTHKPERGWTPKAYKEREIPIPTRLVKSLKAWKAKANENCNLVFPTSGCNPKLNFLDSLKAVAERARLDPENFWLHKFRATFATRCLWAGVDLRTVQQWLGHSDMESTMRYLKPSRSQHVREKVNEIFA